MASTRKAGISAELRADRGKFKADLAAATQDVRAFGNEARKAGGSFNPGGDGKWAAMGGKVAAFQAALAGAQKAKDMLAEPERIELEFETALAGLAAVQKGAESLEEQVRALSELGDKPGLGFMQVMKVSAALQSVGQDAAEARRTMEEFGNAIALAGGGKQEFEESMMAVRKMLTTGVTQEQLDVVADRSPQAMSAMVGLDRSDPKKFMEQAVERMKSLPRAQTTAQGQLENVEDAWIKKWLEVNAGAAVARRKVIADRTIEALQIPGMAGVAAGKVTEVGGEIAERGKGITGTAPKLTDLYETSAEEIARRKRVEEEAAAAKAAKVQEELDKQEKLLRLQRDLREYELSGQTVLGDTGDEYREIVANLEDQIAIMERAVELAKQLGISEEQAAEAIKRQNAIRRETAALSEKVRTPEQRADMARTKEQAEIDRLRASGKGRQADKRQAELDKKTETEQLKAQGFSEEQAAQIAGMNAQTKEDQEYFDRTGRRKIRAKPRKETKGGIDGAKENQFDFSGFFDGKIDYDFNQKKLPAAKAKAAADAAAKSAEDPASNPMVKALMDGFASLRAKFDELINNGTVAEKTAAKAA